MKIEFQPSSKDNNLIFDMPKPASQVIPDWYKNMVVHMDGEKETGLSSESTTTSNLTLKGCTPFLDALMTGYIFTLPFDIEFRNHGSKGMQIRWAIAEVNAITSHAPEQAPNLPTAVGGLDGIFKWSSGWSMKTPKGYSTLFTHPINRHDLPFRTFSGVVDTDTYSLPVDFPFQLLNSFDKEITIIEKGTPICQAIPIKRDSFFSEQVDFNPEEFKRNASKLKSKIVRSYKNQFWTKKEYR